MRAYEQVKVLIITGFGLNCEQETTVAFTITGASVTKCHLNDLLADKAQLLKHHILALIGGFSFGDHLGAGTILANRIDRYLGKELKQFIERGHLIIGICNGFQTLSRLRLLPGLQGAQDEIQGITLAPNPSGRFRNAWIRVKCNPRSPCIFTRGIEPISLPIRHGEGKFIPANSMVLDALESQHLAAMYYIDAKSQPAYAFPDNPNGSIHAIAGICNPSGRIFGLMPHPEGYLSPYNHPHWMRQKINHTLPKKGSGQQIFYNAVRFAAQELC